MRHLWIFVLAIPSILLLLNCSDEERASQDECTVIIGAFEDEIENIVECVTEPEDILVYGLHFMKGYLNGKQVVVGISGIGKVNAAMTTAIVIQNFHPKQIIFTGIAGGLHPDIRPGDMIIGRHTVQHDLLFIGSDTLYPYITKNPVDGTFNPVYYQADSSLYATALRVAAKFDSSHVMTAIDGRNPKVLSGIIASGDAFIASSARKEDLISRFYADAVEMEGAAVAQVCYQLGVPCLVVRSISDSADDKAKVTLEEFYRIAAQNSAELVMAIVAEL